MTDNQIGIAFLNETINRINKSFKRIHHCIDQLDESDIWWRPNDKMNSVGNLILHIHGNLTQWILHGLGGENDIRDRPGEFDNRQFKSKEELMKLLADLKTKIELTLKNFNPNRLLEEKRIQGFDLQLLNAVYGTITHLEGHTGQIVYITRLRKGDAYKIFWQPENEEQASKRNK